MPSKYHESGGTAMSLAGISDRENLPDAWTSTGRGKRGTRAAAAFAHQAADRLLRIQQELRDGSWEPGPYVHYQIQ